MPDATSGVADRRFRVVLCAMLALAAAWRLLYVWSQSTADPWYGAPILDGALYLGWATELARGATGPTGAFYLAPLYPWVLSVFLRIFGENFFLLYLAQHALSLATAALIALAGRRRLGSSAALAAAGLYLVHQPLVFFASRPLGETLALTLLVGALATLWHARTVRGFVLVGALAGLSCLARPNLLLVALGWVVLQGVRRRWSIALGLVVGVALAILPVTARNWIASGHLVPVSANGGITAYHGNGPGAQGIYTHPSGFEWGVDSQQEAARRIASARAGRELDAVQADRWWGRQALATRMGRPWETVRLVARRVWLTLGNYEFGLDYPPMLDPNPWRPTVRAGGGSEVSLVPLALLIGLAAAGLVLHGPRGSGGGATWIAILACAATPIAFYVSSRYRLPMAALLCVPAASGLVGLARAAQAPSLRRVAPALAATVVLVVLSLSASWGDLPRVSQAAGLCTRATAYLDAGRPGSGERDAREAVRLDPEGERTHYTLGVLLAAQKRWRGAEAAYRAAIERRADFVQAASNLGAVLTRRGRHAEAVAVLRTALLWNPTFEEAWINLVVALLAAGDVEGARRAVDDARQRGIEPQRDLIERLDRGRSGGSNAGGG